MRNLAIVVALILLSGCVETQNEPLGNENSRFQFLLEGQQTFDLTNLAKTGSLLGLRIDGTSNVGLLALIGMNETSIDVSNTYVDTLERTNDGSASNLIADQMGPLVIRTDSFDSVYLVLGTDQIENHSVSISIYTNDVEETLIANLEDPIDWSVPRGVQETPPTVEGVRVSKHFATDSWFNVNREWRYDQARDREMDFQASTQGSSATFTRMVDASWPSLKHDTQMHYVTWNMTSNAGNISFTAAGETCRSENFLLTPNGEFSAIQSSMELDGFTFDVASTGEGDFRFEYLGLSGLPEGRNIAGWHHGNTVAIC